MFSITNSTFSKNIAQEIGGGFATRLADGSIENCDFLNNTAVSGQGGGVYMDTVVSDVINSRCIALAARWSLTMRGIALSSSVYPLCMHTAANYEPTVYKPPPPKWD